MLGPENDKTKGIIYLIFGVIKQIYHVWDGYLRKIPVETKLFVSRLIFFASTPPKHDISV